jgi:thiol-disulfide isomerase/thioredoxin
MYIHIANTNCADVSFLLVPEFFSFSCHIYVSQKRLHIMITTILSIHPILNWISLIFLLSLLTSVQSFMSRGLSDSVWKDSSLNYNTIPYQEKDGLVTHVIPNIPSIPNQLSNIHLATTIEEYDRILSEQKDKLIVTRFYMTNCKACVAMTPSFYRLVRSQPNLAFVDIPISKENKDIHLRLGVETVPFAHVNHPTYGLVEQRKISRRHWDEFQGVVQSYVDGQCELTKEDCSNPYHVELDLDPNYF